MSEWISVEDRMPAQDQTVVITGFSRCRGDITDVRFKVLAVYVDGTFYNDETGDDFYPPTHWLDIPELPK